MSTCLKQFGLIVGIGVLVCASRVCPGDMITLAGAKMSLLAVQCGGHMEPWIRLDLTPALDSPLMTRTIQDEGATVAAQQGMVFLTLPLRYDRTAGPKTLTKASFRGRDMRGFYGLRCLSVHKGRLDLWAYEESEPVYERLELKGDDGGKSRKPKAESRKPKTESRKSKVEGRKSKGVRVNITGKNTLGPRRVDGKTTKRDRPKRRFPQTVRASGWAALVVEIPESATHLTFRWVDRGDGNGPGELDGVVETLDLTFLQSVRDRLSFRVEKAPEEGRRGSVMPPDVSSILQRLTGKSSATAAVAIQRLQRLHREVKGLNLAEVPGAMPAWMARVDAAVITAGARGEEDVRSAAWGYFAFQPSVSEETAAFLGRQGTRVQREWITLIQSNISKRDTAKWSARPQPEVISRPRDEPASRAEANISIATDLLGGILRSNSVSVCDSALEILLSLGRHVDWSLAKRTSETSQSLALSRLEAVTDEASARQLLSALLHDVRPAFAAKLATHARRLNVRISSPDDVLLTQWAAMDKPAEQAGLLKVLGAVSLGDLVYSQRLATIINNATADDAAGTVREAAFQMLVRQSRRRLEPSGVGGGFPVLVKADARDPLVDGLARAARMGSRQTRIEALAALVLMGHAESAAVSLVDGARDGTERGALLKQLVAFDAGVAHSDGLLAMLGHLLHEKNMSSVEFILSHLSDTWASTPDSQQWRRVAAVKAGIDFGALTRLGAASAQPASGEVAHWLYVLGHLTAQDRQRFASSSSVDGHMRCLKRADFRRGYLVDGRYGALAVLETVVARQHPEQAEDANPRHRHYRWGVPRRVTVVLPELRLETTNEDDTYQVLYGTQVLGQGLAKDSEKIRPPSSISPRLENPDEQLLGVNGWGWPDMIRSMKLNQAAVGPIVLPERHVSANPAPGTMTLDIGSCLLAAVREQRVFGKENVEGLVPTPCRMTLRYAAFGSFYGVGQRRNPPGRSASAGQRHLLNVMVVLERIDE